MCTNISLSLEQQLHLNITVVSKYVTYVTVKAKIIFLKTYV